MEKCAFSGSQSVVCVAVLVVAVHVNSHPSFDVVALFVYFRGSSFVSFGVRRNPT